MINNRQAGRRRGRGGGGNGQRPGGNPGRPDNGNRIDNRARGNANQLYEKYKNLASDAQRQGDRVNTEYYLQFADHYFRVLSESRSRFEEQGQRRHRDDNYVNGFDNDFDGDEDFADEGEPIRAGEQGGDQANGGQGNGGQEPRREGQRRDGNGDRGSERGRDRRDRRDEERRPAQAQPSINGHSNGHAEAAEPEEARAPAAVQPSQDAEAPVEGRRRGRPRRERGPVEEAGAGDAGAGLEADRLPPALGAGTDAGEAAEEAPKPRRRRARVAQDEAPAA